MFKCNSKLRFPKLRTVLSLPFLASLAVSLSFAAETINIGVMGPKSHILGQTIFNAATLAADEINAQGGIDGKQIKLYEYDTNFSATDATRSIQRAKQQDDVSAMVGIFTSEVALAMMPWSSRLKLPLIVTTATLTDIADKVAAEPERYKYVFHSYVNSRVLGAQICAAQKLYFAKNETLRKYGRVALFAEDAEWTKPVMAMYKECLPDAGVSIVDTLVFAPNTTDFAPLYSRIKKAKADAIITVVGHVGVESVIQWNQQQVPALMTGINAQATASQFWKATNGSTEGLISTTAALNGAPITDRTPAFFEAYTKRFGVAQPAFNAYTTYDTIYALKHAIAKAGSADPDKLVAALETVDFKGTLGQFRFHGKDGAYPHEVVADFADPAKGLSFLVFQWQSGKQVILWPERLAEGQPKIPAFVP